MLSSPAALDPVLGLGSALVEAPLPAVAKVVVVPNWTVPLWELPLQLIWPVVCPAAKSKLLSF